MNSRIQTRRHVTALGQTPFMVGNNHSLDEARLPISFVWIAMTRNERQSAFQHEEVFYRLDRKVVQGRFTLVPSEHYHTTATQLIELLARRPTPLPKIPDGYVWHGPFARVISPPPGIDSKVTVTLPLPKGLERASFLAQQVLQRMGCPSETTEGGSV